MLALVLALQASNYAAAGESWAREPTSAACYVELASGMDDPTRARDSEVRQRLRAVAQEMAGLAQGSFYQASGLEAKRDADLREKQDLLDHGLMAQAEIDEAAASWDYALQAQRYVLSRIITRYPSCDFLRPLRWVGNYENIVNAAMAVTEPPEQP